MSGNNAPLPQCRGFSLVELMTVLVIAAIALTVALPSFNGVLERNRLAAQANDITAALAYARSEAIRRNVQVSFCPVNSTDNGCDAGGSWARGWLVWADDDNDGAVDAAVVPSEVLRTGRVADGITLAPAQTVGGVSTAIASVAFGPRGTRSLPAADATVAVRATTCPSGKPLVRNLVINRVGSTTSAQANCPAS